MDQVRVLSRAELVATYIRAKDWNRPHLMKAAFSEDASLEVVVRAGTITFPPVSKGLDAITEVLVRRFGQAFENVYTLCLSSPPASDRAAFSCAWLVGMSEKEGGAVRVGAGRYDWSFRNGLVDRLRITIELMQALPPGALPPVMNWLSNLPHPWCPVGAARRTLPDVSGLEVVANHLREMDRVTTRRREP